VAQACFIRLPQCSRNACFSPQSLSNSNRRRRRTIHDARSSGNRWTRTP
jgi:hypothetical protein